jgi:CRP/FNR family transcriptional regulator, cyclic AMP receptor protein
MVIIMTVTPHEEPYKNVMEQLLHYCHVKTYPPKTIVFRPGDLGDRLHYIVDGSVSISVENEDVDNDQELVLAYLNKHDFIGTIGVFKGSETRNVTIMTRTQCQLAEISYLRFQQVLRKELLEYAPDILLMMGGQLAGRLLKTSRKFSDLAFMDVEGRIARALLDLCQEPDAMTHPKGMQLYITRQEIGRIVGCSREMAGRVMKEMEDKGLISAHGKTIVVFGTR